jgi:hypothetical protein
MRARVQSYWQSTGNVGAAELKPVRIQLHSAAQLVAAVGKALANPQPDDSHTSLEWDSERNAFAGVKIKQPPVQALLEVLTMTLSIVEGESKTARNIELRGHTLGEGFEWLRATLKELGAEARLNEAGDRSQLPDGVFGETERFDGTALAELSEWVRHYRNAHLMLQEVSTARPGFSAIRVWPHHFDIASLCVLKPEGSEQKTIGVGLSPGDGSYDEPYWYVTPWPYPDAKNLELLDGAGSWHTQGWVGAVLPVSQMLSNGAKDQAGQVRAFLQSAIRICERVLKTN